MNFSTFLVILTINHVKLILCLKGNLSENDNCSLCTVSFFRRKRALANYTRWQSNSETTPEFIVKVLEDDITTPHTKQIVAVNIRPFTKGEEKIIIGGVTLLSTVAPITPPLSDEYTRFVPPTALALTRYEDIVLAPATLANINHKIPPIKPKNKFIKGEQQIGPIIKFSGERHAQRDDSPPSGPKFISRSKSDYVSQYAPVSPNIYNKLTTIGPLTPRAVDKFLLYKTSVRPTRTPPLDIIVPMRTSDFLSIFSFEDKSRHPLIFFPTRTSIYSSDDQDPTTESRLINDNNDDFVKPTKGTDEFHRRKNYEDKKKVLDKIADKESDDSYNMMIYDDDDTTSKKTSHGFTDAYEENSEKNEIDDENTHTKILSSTKNDLDEFENNTESKLDYNEEDDMRKGSTLTRQYNGVATLGTTKCLKDNILTNRTRSCSLLKLRQLSFSSPRTLHEITSQLKQWAEESPVAKWIDITDGNYTVMENPIYMMIVDDPSSGQIMSAKQTVMIVAGIQGRDHHAVAAAMYVLYQLIERTEAHSNLLTKYRFWIIPVFNPDGYDYSVTFPRRREWTKNLRQTWDSCKGRDSCQSCELYGIMCNIQPCYGVNLDRNFEYQWIPRNRKTGSYMASETLPSSVRSAITATEELRSEHPCGALYAGQRQLSEAETRALTHFLHEQKTPLYTFIAFKEGDVLGVMYPYSHTRKRRAFDHVYRQRASRAAAAAYSISGRPYVAGQTSEFLPLYAGGIEDWVDGHLGIDNTYTVMMFRPTDAYSSKLLTEKIVHEAFAVIDTLLSQRVEPLGPPPVTLTRSKAFLLLPSIINIVYVFIAMGLFSLVQIASIH